MHAMPVGWSGAFGLDNYNCFIINKRILRARDRVMCNV